MPHLGINLKETKTLIWRYMDSHIHSSIIYSSQDTEAAQVSTSGSVDTYTYPHMRIYTQIYTKMHTYTCTTEPHPGIWKNEIYTYSHVRIYTQMYAYKCTTEPYSGIWKNAIYTYSHVRIYTDIHANAYIHMHNRTPPRHMKERSRVIFASAYQAWGNVPYEVSQTERDKQGESSLARVS